MSERVLAARKLQKPLSAPLCKAALYPASEGAWRVERVSLLAGRGPTLEEAMEALCREADGLQAQAVSDIYTTRAPSGWAPTHEVRGWALRYEAGFSPPPPPARAEVRPLALVPAEEPPPQGETPEPPPR
jgi:hypothetical protein